MEVFFKCRHQSIKGIASKMGVDDTTLRRWAKNGLSPVAMGYLRLCIIFKCSPQDLIDYDLKEFCRLRSAPMELVAVLCGFRSHRYFVETGYKLSRNKSALATLKGIYSYNNSFEPWLDVHQIKDELAHNVHSFANLVCYA